MNARSSWAILGAAGYAGGELLNLMLNHRRAEVTQVVSSSAAGRVVGEVHPNLRGLCELQFAGELDLDAGEHLDGIFFCGRHGDAMALIPALLERHPDLRVIDLSADFRLQDPGLYPEWYGREHAAPELLASFAYGLPELNREAIRGSGRVANPGCFATAITLALAPLSRAVSPASTVTVTAVTGSSGSGALPSARTHHPTRAATLRAYRPLAHQHTPEILQSLARLSPGGAAPRIAFVPVSGPIVRGIYAVCQAALPDGWDAQRLRSIYKELYADEPFVRLTAIPADLQVVTGSNFCDLYVDAQEGLAVVIAAVDNLVKGAAGQAVQNMNLMMGWDEAEGLRLAGGYP
jgi:N-acetyl-gamma-glutamyl-phosphate reductase